jgi:hypothetical protein
VKTVKVTSSENKTLLLKIKFLKEKRTRNLKRIRNVILISFRFILTVSQKLRSVSHEFRFVPFRFTNLSFSFRSVSFRFKFFPFLPFRFASFRFVSQTLFIFHFIITLLRWLQKYVDLKYLDFG